MQVVSKVKSQVICSIRFGSPLHLTQGPLKVPRRSHYRLNILGNSRPLRLSASFPFDPQSPDQRLKQQHAHHAQDRVPQLNSIPYPRSRAREQKLEEVVDLIEVFLLGDQVPLVAFTPIDTVYWSLRLATFPGRSISNRGVLNSNRIARVGRVNHGNSFLCLLWCGVAGSY